MLRAMLSFALLVALLVGLDATAQEKVKKEAEKGKSGTVIGVLVAKDKGSIDVKAAGEEKPRKYVPHWRGDAPAQGGGPDKEMLQTFAKLKVGSRIELKWEFEEHFRAVAVKVLTEPPANKD